MQTVSSKQTTVDGLRHITNTGSIDLHNAKGCKRYGKNNNQTIEVLLYVFLLMRLQFEAK